MLRGQEAITCQDYNKHMGAVDQVSLSYPYPHRSYKWYFPMYHFLVETAIVNAYTLYKRDSPQNKLKFLKMQTEDLLEAN